MEVNASSNSVMPPFGEVEDVVTYLDDIWAYLRARADGALGQIVATGTTHEDGAAH